MSVIIIVVIIIFIIIIIIVFQVDLKFPALIFGHDASKGWRLKFMMQESIRVESEETRIILCGWKEKDKSQQIKYPI